MAPQYGEFPTTGCFLTMVADANAAIVAAQVIARGPLDAFMLDLGFVTEARERGWAGMGIWYHRIETLNSAVADMQVPKISITAGDPSNGGNSDHARKVIEVLNVYDAWWLNLQNDPNLVVAAPNANPVLITDVVTNAPDNNVKPAKLKTSIKSLGASMVSITPFKLGDTIADLLSVGMSRTIFNMIDPADDDTYPLAKLAKIGIGMMTGATLIYLIMAVIEMIGAGFACSLALKATAGTVFSVCSVMEEMAESALPPIFLTTASMMFFGGILMRYYIPLLPFISVAHAVLTWMISVFEATMMVPLAALSHLTTEGEGISGHSKQIWILWLNILMRPILTVIGFVAAFLVFNTFVVFLHLVFVDMVVVGFTGTGMAGFFAKGFYSIIYVFIIYSAATSCFKLLDLIPDALFRWLGGSPDKSFDSNTAGALNAFSNVAMSFGSGFGKSGRKFSDWKKKDNPSTSGSPGGGSNPISPGGTTRHNIS